MSTQPSHVPDAWDDNWEAIADRQSQTPDPQPEKKVPARVTKAQRRAQQAEFNRQLWAEAEAAQTYHFLETRAATIPLKSEYKPPVTVLSRRPQIARRPTPSSPSVLSTAVSGLSLNDNGVEDGDDENSEAEGKKQPQLTPEERQAIALREREEKQRKYEEVRERLFGPSSATGSAASSPGSTTPPSSQNQRQENNSNRWRGRNRQHNGRGDSRENNRESRRGSPASAGSGRHKQLFDPNYSPKPNSNYVQKKEKQQRRNNIDSTSSSLSDEMGERTQTPIRDPRGPDGSGRGGFGFAQGAGRGRGR
ncbi:hypothetical protein VTO42DRAFT_5535 [Malbranchea cinnamomea]